MTAAARDAGEPRRFASAADAGARLEAAGYLPSPEVAMVAFLMDRLERPVLVEGPAGVGKTAFAVAAAAALGRQLVRLQCYEGLDEAKALYEWEYAKQLLYTQLLRDQLAPLVAGAASLDEAADRIAASDAVFFSRRFLLPRPVLRAILSEEPALLLVDEIDKADPEFEAFLLEVLADNAVTVPELGTIAARHVPRVVLTSNGVRELSDALRRRCVHLAVAFPSRDRELAIIRARVPDIGARLAGQLVDAVARLRTLELRKPPSISETIDWARGLVLLSTDTLSADVLRATLGLLLKHETDAALARANAASLVPQA